MPVMFWDLKWEELRRLSKSTTADIAHDSLAPERPVPPSQAEAGLANLPQEARDALKSLALDVLSSFENDSPSDTTAELTLQHRLDDEIKATYKKFYDFVYQDLPFCWRQLYTDLSILKFNYLLTVIGALVVDDNRPDRAQGAQEAEIVDAMVATLDKALILSGGAGIRRGRTIIEKILRLLEEAYQSETNRDSEEVGEPPAKRPRTERTYDDDRPFSSKRIFDPPLKHPVERLEQMTMGRFQKYMDDGHTKGKDGPLPFVVRGITADWPAMTIRPWNKPAYLLSRTFGGRRLVPVEVGRSYVDDGWGQELIPFRELLDRMEDSVASPQPTQPTQHGTENTDEEKEPSPAKPPSYLAQHELFTQLPILRNDIPTPDLCYTSPPPHPLSPSMNKPELPLPLINAWLGPAGTITPLHTDGYHNLLAQVVGAKYVRLYSPLDSEALCPRGEDEDGIDMHNTSAFDVGVIEGWDAPPPGEVVPDDIELAEFRGLRRWETVLEEGDVLYVPIGWWHYVRSLSISFSVSFWWNGDHGAVDETT